MSRKNTRRVLWLFHSAMFCGGCASPVEDQPNAPDVDVAVEPIYSVRDVGATPQHFVVSYDANNAYFTSLAGEFCTSGTWVQKMSLTSGAVTTLVEGACRSAAQSASDGRDLFFLEWGSDDVRRVPVAAGAVDRFVNDATGAVFHRGIAVNDTRVFWADDRGIRSAPKGGGAGSTLAGATQADLLGIDATHAYFDCQGSSVTRRDLRRVALAGGTVQVLHTNTRGHRGAALIGSHVFFASNEGSGSTRRVTLERIAKTGGTTTSVHVVSGCDSRSINDVRGDATSLFWSESTQCAPPMNRHSIKRLSQPGGAGAVFSVKDTVEASYGLHVTNNSLFWIDGPIGSKRLFSAHRDDASCAGFCGASSPMGCYCDAACSGFGDCCFDAATTCH